MYWKIVGKTDDRARALADRHYSRQSPGAVEFCPPGNSIVLLGLNDDALWVSHRPDPNADSIYAKRNDGFEYWDNPYFRNESGHRASTLIQQALAVTMYIWQDHQPPDGFHSFVNPRHVKGVKVRGKTIYGWVFQQAGFELYPERTKARNLLRWVYSLDQLLAIDPRPPMIEAPLFGGFVSQDIFTA